MLGLGLKPGAHERRRDRYRILARALLFNLIAVPGIAVLVTRVTRTSTDVTNALLLLAAAPGGGVAPHLAVVAGGDVALSTEITLLLAKITVFTAPATAEWILGLHHRRPRALGGEEGRHPC